MMKPLVLAYLHQRAAVIVMLLAACVLTAFGNDDPAAFGAIALGTVVLSWMVVPSGVNAFTCALPIRGADLVMSRVYGAIAVAVVPIAGWASLEWGSEQTPPVLFMPNVHLGALAVAIGVAVAWAWINYTVPDALPLPSNERGGWKRIPQRQAGTLTDIARRNVIRAALPPIFAVYCALLIGTSAVGAATLVYGIVLLSLPGIIRQRSQWLDALPVSDRQRLQLIVLPTVVASVACIVVGQVLRPSMFAGREQFYADYRLWLIDAVVLMVLGVMVLLLAEVGGALSRRRRGLVAFLLGELATIAVAFVVVDDIVPRMRGMDGIVAHTARMLHETAASSAVHAWSVLVLAVMMLVTAYALLEQQFRRSGTLAGADVTSE